MFRIIDDFLPMQFQVGDGITDHGKVFSERDIQDISNMEVPGLSENGNHRRFRLNNGCQIRTIFRPDMGLSGTAEGGEASMLETSMLGQFEETCIFWIGARPPSFYIMKTHIIETLGNSKLLLCREIDLFTLGSIPQCCIIN